MRKDQMRKRIEKLEAAVEEAREMFDFYARHHKNKGDAEKEARNRELADKMAEAMR